MSEPIGSPTEGTPAIPQANESVAAEIPAQPESVLDRDTSGLDREASQAALKATREEAAKHRVEAREAKERVTELENRYQVFEQYDEQDRSTWVGLANEWAQNPETAANNFRTIANNVLGDPNATPEQVEAAEEILEQTPSTDAVTPETVAALMDEKLTARDQQAQQKAAIENVHAQISEAGYPQGTMENFGVLWIANNDPAAEGDVGKAIEIMKAKEQSKITQYQESLRGGSSVPRIPDGGLPGSAAPGEITSMDEASAGAKAFLMGRQRS